MRVAALTTGPLTRIDRRLFAAVQESILDSDFEIHGLEPIEPREVAQQIRGHQKRVQLIHCLILVALVDGRADPLRVEAVERFAAALDVVEPSLGNLRQVSKGQLLRMRLDLTLRHYGGRKLREVWRSEGARGIWRMAGALFGVTAEDPALAGRYQRLQHLQERTLGREYYEFCRRNRIALPGERGGLPESYVFHDLTHLLGGYDTSTAGELQAGAFAAGCQSWDPFSSVFWTIMQFHFGIRMTPVEKSHAGLLDPVPFLRAYRRGTAMTVDPSDSWDYWAVMERPLEEVRRLYHVPPEPELRLEAESSTAHAQDVSTVRYT